MKRYIFILLIMIISAVSSEAAKKVIIVDVDAGIGPGIASYIESSIERAEEMKAEALIIRLDTPGGLLESTRDIVGSIMESPVPVVVYVGPGGARAGSAGVFITLAANIAVMAPGTNIGAAHPVGIGGESDSSAMFDKVTNDAAAFVRTIAQKRNRNEEWAELAVRESISATENEAYEKGVIDFICPNIDSLLKAIDGFETNIDGEIVQLNTKNAKAVEIEMNWKDKLLTFLSDPNIAYIFMMLAIYGIMMELYNPGSIFPGVIGGISGVLAGYSLQMLPVNYAGLALILLAIILFLIEIKVPSYGMLTVGGVLSLFLGSVMLIDSPFEFISISMTLILTFVVLTVLFFGVIIAYGIKAQSRKKASGTDALVGEKGYAATDIEPGAKGKVKVHGEIWSALSDVKIAKGEQITVKKVEGFTLRISK